jgi:hypothetical protein
MSFNQVNSSGELERVAGLVNSEKINEMYEAFPSDASANNKLVTVSGKIRGLNTGNWISTSFDDAVPSDNASMQIFTVLNSAVHTPATGANYMVIAQAFDENNIQQEAIQNVTNNRYIRYYNGTSWSSWQKLVTESDLDAVSRVYEYTSSNAPTKASFINLLVSSNAHMDFKFINVTADYTPNASSYWYIQKFGGADALHVRLLAMDWVSGDLYIGDANSANNTITWWRLSGTQV